MSSVINTNLLSLNAQQALDSTTNELSTAMQRLSTGLRINSAADDAAGLAIATRMTSQINGMTVAIQNANDGVSLAQTADSALASVTNSLQTMRNLAVQSSNATNSPSDKQSLDQEFGQLADEVQRVLGGTTFNGQTILGSNAGSLTFQVGANTTSNDTITITTNDLTVNASIITVAGTDNQGTGRATIGSAASDAQIATVINNIDAAINVIDSQRAIYGATENRFQAVVSNLQSSVTNQTAAQSSIMDADYATETAALSRSEILQQAGNAMVAQANQEPQLVLKLLGG